MKVTNQAMLHRTPQFNEFTLKLAELLKDRSEVDVVLRNGRRTTVIEFNGVENCFFSEGYELAWNRDGSSCTAQGHDIIEMEI